MIRCLVVLLSIVLLAPLIGLAGEIERIQNKGIVTVSLNRDNPPFCMGSDDAVYGLDVDLANLMADYLGVQVQFIRPETYDQQIPLLLAGKTDVIIAAMTRTMERALRVNFTNPYFEVSQAALADREKVPQSAAAYFDLLEIDGLRLGVKQGTTHEDLARILFPANMIKVYPTADAAAAAVVNGEIDAMVADSPFVQVWHNTHIEHYTSIKALLKPVTREFYAFAIRQGDADFLNWLNQFVDQIKTDGTLDLLIHEYFEQMDWVKGRKSPLDAKNRAEFIKKRFFLDEKAKFDQRSKLFRGQGDRYE